MKNKKKPQNTGTAVKIFRLVFPGIVLLLMGIWFGKGFNPASHIKGVDEFPSATVLEVPVPLPAFSLTDHNGKEFTPSNLSRKWTFMFFGYTHCPDVCPTALVDLNAVYNNLVEKGDLIERKYKVNTQVVFITVDPQRDTVEQLNEYIPFFNRDFIGITGDPEVIASLGRSLGVSYRRMPGSDSEDGYLVDHSASFLLIDPLSRMRAIFLPPHDPGRIAKDFRRIRNKFTAECCATNDKPETTIFDYRKEKK